MKRSGPGGQSKWGQNPVKLTGVTILSFFCQYNGQDVVRIDLDWGNVWHLDKHHNFGRTLEKPGQIPELTIIFHGTIFSFYAVVDAYVWLMCHVWHWPRDCWTLYSSSNHLWPGSLPRLKRTFDLFICFHKNCHKPWAWQLSITIVWE